MSEPVEYNEQSIEPSPLPSVGAMLSEAREKSGLTIEEVASRLRLSPRQVRALEADDVDALPGPTFVRGFVRNYAKLLALDSEPLLRILRASTPESQPSSINLPSENIAIVGRDKKGWLPYALASIAIGLALGGWLVYTEEQEAPLATQAKEEAPLQKGKEPEPTPPAVPVVEQPAPQPEAATPPLSAATTPAPVAAATGGARLKLVFSEQSWVSITDRNGKEVYNKTKPAGGEDVVEGTPPFNVVIGNAAGVQLTYKDKPVDLAPHAKANVARFTLE